MGTQRSYADKCRQQRLRGLKRTEDGTRRLWGSQPSRARIEVGELTGYRADRPTLGNKPGGLPNAVRESRAVLLERSAAGTAFDWWTGQSPAEQQETIAAVMAETARFVARQDGIAGRRGRQTIAAQKKKAP